MNNLIQIMMQNKMQQIPQNTMNQLEKQLKRQNPQAFQKYQQARKDNNPQELLDETINNFTPQQKQQWNNFMKMFNQGINTK